MKPFSTIGIITLALMGCQYMPSQQPQRSNNVSVSSGAYTDFGEHGLVSIFDIELDIPGVYMVEQHPEFKHIQEVIISNTSDQAMWPGANAILFIDLAGTDYADMAGYLDEACLNRTKIEDGENYTLSILKKSDDLTVYQIRHNCLTEEGYYSEPTSIEYIITTHDTAILARIDEEADAAAMERFESLMKTAEKSL